MHYNEIALAGAALAALVYCLWNTRSFAEERERAAVEDRQRKALLDATRKRRVGKIEAGHRPPERLAEREKKSPFRINETAIKRSDSDIELTSAG